MLLLFYRNYRNICNNQYAALNVLISKEDEEIIDLKSSRMSNVLMSNMKSSQELQQLTPIKKRIREDRLKMSNVKCRIS